MVTEILRSEFVRYGFNFIMDFIRDSGIILLEFESEDDPALFIVQFSEEQVVGFKFLMSHHEVLAALNHYIKLV